jgi:FMN phosphatase YigB (HAD superfamily)
VDVVHFAIFVSKLAVLATYPATFQKVMKQVTIARSDALFHSDLFAWEISALT